jgi:hypothetical protein
MNLQNLAVLFIIVAAIVLIVLFGVMDKTRKRGNLRPIPSLDNLQKSISQTVEGGKGIHLSIGRAGPLTPQFGGSIMSLALLKYIARQSVNGDIPPYVTCGDGFLNMLGQETLDNAYTSARLPAGYRVNGSQVSGVSSFSYIAGAMMSLRPDDQSVLLIAGSFGSEVALLADLAERRRIHTISGTNDLIAQSMLFVTTRAPLIGEEFFTAGAYTQNSSLQNACLKTQDVLRLVLCGGLLLGAFMKLVGLV